MSSDDPVVIYMDESGNTGENLKDDDQPVFTFAGVRLGNDDANELVQFVMGKLRLDNTGELKSRSLLRSPKREAVLLEALQRIPADAAFTFTADKQWMIVSKLVDLLVVETAYRRGYDMYVDGSARGLAHLFHYLGPVLGDSQAWRQLLDAFVDVAAGKEDAPLLRFMLATETFLAADGVKDEWPFGTLRSVGWEAFHYWWSRRQGLFRDHLDPAVAGFAVYCNEIGKRVGRFKLVCDKSRVLEDQASFLMSMNQYPDLANPGHMLPRTPITEITFADSATSPQIQVADWIAAVARRHAASFLPGSTTRPLPEGLAALVLGWMVWTLWPDPVEEFLADLAG